MSSNAGLLPELPDDFDRVLAVVAHPDDLEYGASLDALTGDMADARAFLTGMAESAGERFGGRSAALFHVFGA